MKMMIAFRRVSTPMTPIVNRTAESASDSASIDVSPSAENDSACDCNEQQHARQLEREQVFIEEWPRHSTYCAVLCHLLGVEACRHGEFPRDRRAGYGAKLGNERNSNQSRNEHRPFPAS